MGEWSNQFNRQRLRNGHHLWTPRLHEERMEPSMALVGQRCPGRSEADGDVVVVLNALPHEEHQLPLLRYNCTHNVT